MISSSIFRSAASERFAFGSISLAHLAQCLHLPVLRDQTLVKISPFTFTSICSMMSAPRRREPRDGHQKCERGQDRSVSHNVLQSKILPLIEEVAQ